MKKPNAAAQARQTAGAERTLFAVACSRLFGFNLHLRTAPPVIPNRAPVEKKTTVLPATLSRCSGYQDRYGDGRMYAR